MLRFLLIALILLLAACASAPRDELQSARTALTQAHHAGAPSLTPEAYRAALESLRRGEALIREKDYAEARKILPVAEEQARDAMRLAGQEKERLAAERAAAAAAAAAAPTARLPAATPRAVPPPPRTATAPPAPQPQKPQTAAPHKPDPPSRYTVKDNDSLISIAALEEIYGDALLWPLLYQANRDQIRDPRRIYPGQTLVVPRATAPEELQEIRRRARSSDVFPAAGQSAPSAHTAR